jgi:hypothetical protein
MDRGTNRDVAQRQRVAGLIGASEPFMSGVPTVTPLGAMMYRRSPSA